MKKITILLLSLLMGVCICASCGESNTRKKQSTKVVSSEDSGSEKIVSPIENGGDYQFSD